MNNNPISQEHTLARFLRAGWKKVDQEKRIIFIQGLDGMVRVIDEYGYMWFISKFIGKNGDSEKLEKWLNYNSDLYYKKRGIYR